MRRHVFDTPRLRVPDNIVKQIAEGRPVVLALLCSGLRTYYLPAAEERLEIADEQAWPACGSRRGLRGAESN